MTLDPRLNFLVELREQARVSQEEIARHFGLTGTQSYKSVAAWEKGTNKPQERRRQKFISYLWDLLRLRNDPQRFEAYWAVLVEVWRWEPLSPVERLELHLPPIPKRESDQEKATLLRQFSEFYQQTHNPLDVAQLEAQVTEYLTWLVEETEYIELRGIPARGGAPVALPLETIYVPLRVELTGKRQQSPEERDVDLDQVLALGDRLAVIGGPGSGKSTVLQYIAWVLATALLHNDPLFAAQKLGWQLSDANPLPPLPLLFPLSAYARQRFHPTPLNAGLTFPEFIQQYLTQSHCNIGGLPADFFKRLLESGRSVILLLDGLDEVPNESQREIVTQTIQRMVSGRNHLIRAVVTCRSVAYKEQAILGHGFQVVTVKPLDEEHVEMLVRQAYAGVYVNNLDERLARIAELLTGLERLEVEHTRRMSRLINSPLLVRMLLVVHLNDRKMPQHRAELYKRFVDTILKSEHVHDRTVAADLSALDGNNLALMSHLAFAMHQQGQDQGRAIELDTLRSLLQPDYMAETDAFLRLIHLRGTLMEERDGYYRFVHLAFQEYLAARHIAEVYWRDEGMKQTIQFIAQQTLNPWWREVITLLPGYLREALPPHAKRVVAALAGLNEWQTTVTAWSNNVQVAATEIAATATLEWFVDDMELRQQLVQRIAAWFTHNRSIFHLTEPRQRALAGRTLAALGDPRFRSDAWFLPDEPLLGFVEIPAGPFIMGEGDMQHTVDLPTYYIARYPVTVAQFRAYLDATGTQREYEGSLADPANHPVPWVSWSEATHYCAWLDEILRTSPQTPAELAEKLANGWRIMLPSEAEWEKAARGPYGQPYPWAGDTSDPTLANCEESGIGSTSAVGCFPAGISPYGVEELASNVWEWTRSRYLAYPYPDTEEGRWARECLTAKNSDDLVLRGTAFYNSVKSLYTMSRFRISPIVRLDYSGFRVGCVLTPVVDRKAVT